MKIILKRLIILIYPFIRPYWRILKPRTQGVKVILIYKHSVLIIRNSYRKHGWTFPGGGIKKGESSEDAARREVQEELGISIKNIRSHGSFLSTAEGKQDTIWVFSSKLNDKEFQTDNLEIAEAKWVDINQLYTEKVNLFPVAKKCLMKFKAEGI